MTRGAATLEFPIGATCARIAGFVAVSGDAWPGRRAATVLISGCPLRCPYCPRPELVGDAHHSNATLADILGYLTQAQGQVEGVVVSGGEPTSDDSLPELLRALRAEGLPVKLDTNGTEPAMLANVLAEELVDFVSLDVKATPERHETLTGTACWPQVAASADLLRASGVEHEFTLTCYPPAVSLDDIARIASLLARGQRLVLRHASRTRTLDSAAAHVAPYPNSELVRAVARCTPFLPTVVRGG